MKRYSFFVIFCFILTLFSVALKAQEKGMATYYAKRFHNRKTASGAIYKRENFVCAHKTHPFGTKLLVRNTLNDSTIVVEVIDRGPHKKGRIIDLSYAAASQLDLIRHGLAKVEVSIWNDTTMNTGFSPEIFKIDSITKTF